MKTTPPMGWVYLMRNKSMPGMAKIGFTWDDPLERANQLSSSTSVPNEFVVIYAVKTPIPSELEDEIHIQLHERRVASRREFFSTAILIAYDATTDTKHMANEDQENQWFILKMKNSARILSARQRAWGFRDKFDRRLDACRIQEARFFDSEAREIVEQQAFERRQDDNTDYKEFQRWQAKVNNH